MEIEYGRIFINKTWKYLLPATRAYGQTFRNKLGVVWKLVVGIGDAKYDAGGRRCLFILIDRKWFPERVQVTLEWVRQQEYFVDDYAFDHPIKGRQHMVVIEFPKELAESYDYFKKSKYSHMYTEKEVDKFFKDQKIKDAYYVLTRSTEAYDKFIEKLKMSFNDSTEIERTDLLGAELDFPLEPEKEIFNYGAE